MYDIKLQQRQMLLIYVNLLLPSSTETQGLAIPFSTTTVLPTAVISKSRQASSPSAPEGWQLMDYAACSLSGNDASAVVAGQ